MHGLYVCVCACIYSCSLSSQTNTPVLLCIVLGIRIYADASRSYHRLGYNNNDCPSAGSAHAALVFWPDGPVVDPGLLA